MKKGISLYFGRHYDWKKRFQDIKRAGFECFMTTADELFIDQEGAMDERMEYAKEIGLEPDSLHSSYISENLPYFWVEGSFGEEILKKLIYELQLAKQYKFKALVVHCLGEPSFVGLQRMKELVSKAEELGVCIAVENIDNEKILDFILSNIKNDKLKFCFDSGHENFSKEQKNMLERYGDRLICLHLHDNDGNSDMHTLNKYGTINWQKMAQRLSNCSNIENIVLDYEVLMKHKTQDSAEEILKETFAQAVSLEENIKICLKNKNS